VKKKDVSKAKEDILKAMRQGGGFMNNIIGAKLKGIAKAYGTETADSIVIDLKLERLVGIPPEKGRKNTPSPQPTQR